MTAYVDINKSYGVDSRRVILYDVEAINEAIDNIITTSKGERLFNRGFGSQLESILFEPLDETLIQSTIVRISHAMQRFEPRVRININSSAITANYDASQLNIFLSYTIVPSNQIGNFSKTIRYS